MSSNCLRLGIRVAVAALWSIRQPVERVRSRALLAIHRVEPVELRLQRVEERRILDLPTGPLALLPLVLELLLQARDVVAALLPVPPPERPLPREAGISTVEQVVGERPKPSGERGAAPLRVPLAGEAIAMRLLGTRDRPRHRR